MEEKEFMEIFNEIVTALKSAGYNPYEQLIGYLELGNETYITRKKQCKRKKSNC